MWSGVMRSAIHIVQPCMLILALRQTHMLSVSKKYATSMIDSGQKTGVTKVCPIICKNL